MMPTEQVGDFAGGTVAHPNPNDLRWTAAKHAEAVEIFVLGHQYAVALDSERPYTLVGYRRAFNSPHV